MQVHYTDKLLCTTYLYERLVFMATLDRTGVNVRWYIIAQFIYLPKISANCPHTQWYT